MMLIFKLAMTFLSPSSLLLLLALLLPDDVIADDRGGVLLHVSARVHRRLKIMKGEPGVAT